MSNQGPVPTTYEAFEQLYPHLVEGTFSHLQKNIAELTAKNVPVNEADVILAINNALTNEAFENLSKDLLNQVALGLVPYQSPRLNMPQPQHVVNNENMDPSVGVTALLKASWANFDLADTMREVNTLHLPKDIADLLNPQEDQENDLANENKMQNQLRAKPSLTPQFKHTKEQELENRLRKVAELAVEKRLTHLPRLVMG